MEFTLAHAYLTRSLNQSSTLLSFYLYLDVNDDSHVGSRIARGIAFEMEVMMSAISLFLWRISYAISADAFHI